MSTSTNINFNRVSAIGSGLVDFLVFGEDDLVSDIGVKKGSMTLVEMDIIDNILERVIKEKITIVPGGSACNTAVGIGQLGGVARFIGKLGNDSMGDFFKKALIKRNVDPCLFYSALPTGKVLSIITPDAQRTMLTYLGASSEMLPEEITPKYFEKFDLVYIEGYLLFNLELIVKILECAKSSDTLISLDLASFTIVSKYLKNLNKLIPKYVDILIGNEDETKIYTGYEDKEKIIRSMAKNVKIAALKMGDRGSYIAYKNNFCIIDPFSIENAVDTTGAGDLWASGFLFGLINKLSLEKCGILASACGAEACKVVGANIPNNSWHKIKKILHQS